MNIIAMFLKACHFLWKLNFYVSVYMFNILIILLKMSGETCI